MTTLDIMNDLMPKIKAIIQQMPYHNIYISTLGSDNYASIMFVIGLDKRETWKNGIFENSRYMRFSTTRNAKGIELECFTNSMKTIKFRKLTASPEKILLKIQERVNQLKEFLK